MRIGELARRTGISQETIRYYERIGLLAAPKRNPANYRDYAPSDVERLRFIGNCRSLDMTLDEVRQLLDLRDNAQARCGEANALLGEHLLHVQHRIDELTQLAIQLEGIRQQCQTDQATRDCGILNELNRMEPLQAAVETDGGHVPGSHGHRPG